jgi:Zn-dependent oligopeptidase
MERASEGDETMTNANPQIKAEVETLRANNNYAGCQLEKLHISRDAFCKEFMADASESRKNEIREEIAGIDAMIDTYRSEIDMNETQINFWLEKCSHGL